tara:strand:- start:67825 stop:68187 length:363 start_codon:yes stop_codon:yes gene_type:complete
MKNVMLALVLICGFATIQAQEEIKNNYVLNGDLIEATLYNSEGTVSQTGFYTKEGVVTGEWVSYDREGNRTALAQYDRGVKVGKWFFWSDDTLKEVDYNNSQIASVSIWKNENTKVVSNK